MRTAQRLELYSLHWFSERRNPTAHFGACAPGSYDHKVQIRPRFLYNAPIPQVSSSYVYSFGSYRVDKQTDAAENIQRSLLRYDVG